MNTITRDTLVSTYNIVLKKIDDLKKKKYVYKTNRACENFGLVKSMSLEEVVQAGATIHSCEENIQARIEQYGIRPSELKNGGVRKFLGFYIDDWDHDFKLRVSQIRDANDLAKYEKAAKTLSANFSDEDRFRIEMSELENLGLDLTE